MGISGGVSPGWGVVCDISLRIVYRLPSERLNSLQSVLKRHSRDSWLSAKARIRAVSGIYGHLACYSTAIWGLFTGPLVTPAHPCHVDGLTHHYILWSGQVKAQDMVTLCQI